MRFIVFIFILMAGNFARAEQAKGQMALCSVFYAHKLKKPIVDLKKSDKFAHCALSCQLARRCGSLDSFGIGILKEIWDMFTPGDADIKDLEADWQGIRYWQTKMATTDAECVQRCDEKYSIQ